MSEEEQIAEPVFDITKLYIKDASFEAPNSPAAFTDGEWKPEMEVQLKGTNKVVDDDLYEVVLTVTVTVKQNEKTAFLVEIQQAGLFAIKGYPEDTHKNLLGAFCLETLFPFAREAVSSYVRKGGFPQLLLRPVNFSAVYQQQLEAEQAATLDQKAAD